MIERCNRCGEPSAEHSASEICSICDDVPLCQSCFDLHIAELAAEAAIEFRRLFCDNNS